MRKSTTSARTATTSTRSTATTRTQRTARGGSYTATTRAPRAAVTKAVKVMTRATAGLKAAGVYTVEQLSQCWANVKPANWKDPVRVTIANPGSKNLNCLAHAIVYYTGGFATLTPLENGKIRVTARGYTATVGK